MVCNKFDHFLDLATLLPRVCINKTPRRCFPSLLKQVKHIGAKRIGSSSVGKNSNKIMLNLEMRIYIWYNRNSSQCTLLHIIPFC